jgi:hypothetical protein
MSIEFWYENNLGCGSGFNELYGSGSGLGIQIPDPDPVAIKWKKLLFCNFINLF